jgi:uncharacterized membrane-anchored protein
MSRGRRRALVAVVASQLALVLGLAGFAQADLAFGEDIRLVAQPVDPLDVFRGNYVVLRYEISSLRVVFDARVGDRVCAPLHEESGVWSAGFGVPSQPPDDTFICGRVRSVLADDQVEMEYGLETYYASPERARRIEEALARGPVTVVVDLDDDGSARIERVEVD